MPSERAASRIFLRLASRTSALPKTPVQTRLSMTPDRNRAASATANGSPGSIESQLLRNAARSATVRKSSMWFSAGVDSSRGAPKRRRRLC